MVRKPLKATPPRKPAEPGVYLFVRISPDSVQVIKADRVADAPRQPLRAPLPANDAIPQFDDEVPELVLAAIHEDGTITESFGWPADPEWFVETNLEQALVSSQLQTLPVWEARWRIPMPDSVRYLQFSRSDLAWSAGRASPRKQTSLGVFDLKPGTPDRRRSRSWPVPDDRPPTPVPLPAVPASPALRSAAAPRARRAKAAKAKKKKGTAADGGFIKKSVKLVDHGDPSTKFNVVILGDGFTSANLSVFDTHATLVKKALTTTKPFKSLKSRINVYKVSVVSSESGITDCPTCGSTPKNTFFKTTGCFNGVPSSTFIGVSSTQKIFEAVDTAIPQQHAHLVVTIVNCRTGLGSTPPELGLVFLPLTAPGRTALDFMRDALHEAGHGIAKLNEEYNPCNKKKPTRVYPNEATQAEVDAGTVKWKHLARPSELDSSGNLKVVVRFGDPMRAGCKPVLRPSQSKSLGAFWGCHNGNPPATRTAGPAQDHCDPRGQHFYRPMADCRMRRAKAQFCRVCSDEITKVIEGHST
jgi:hypothetical protein